MVLLRSLRSHHFNSFLRHQNSSLSLQTPPNSFPNVHQCVSRISSCLPSAVLHRTLSVTAQSFSSDVTEERMEAETTDSENKKKREKKPLDVMFKEAVGISERHEESETSSEDDESAKEIHELKRKLRKLEREIRSVKMGDLKVTEKNKKKKTSKIKEEEEEISTVESKSKSLYSIFRTKPNNMHSLFVKNSGFEEKSDVSKREIVRESVKLKPLRELSPEIVLLVNRLYEEGYLKEANFLPPKKLDLSCFSSYYSRDFLRFAAEKFGRDHQEIIISLSDDDLKRIALFGCPSVERRTAVAAKRLRSFFGIQEDIVCRPCKLKSSCKVVNHRVWKKMDDLSLADVMRVLTLYGLELVPAQLEIPNKIKDSVSKLLKEVVNPSQILSSTHEDSNQGV